MDISSQKTIVQLQDSQITFDLAIQECQKKSNIQVSTFEVKMTQLINKITNKLVPLN